MQKLPKFWLSCLIFLGLVGNLIPTSAQVVIGTKKTEPPANKTPTPKKPTPVPSNKELPLCISDKLVKVVKTRLEKERKAQENYEAKKKAGKIPPATPKPPEPLTACNAFSEELLDAKVEELQNKKYTSVSNNADAQSLYVKFSEPVINTRVEKIRTIEVKHNFEPGSIVFLAGLESGIQPNAAAPDSTGFSYLQLLDGTAVRMEVLTKSTTINPQGNICSKYNSKKDCVLFSKGACYAPIDNRDNLSVVSDAVAKDGKNIHDNWGPSFFQLYHHQGVTWKQLATLLAKQLYMRDNKMEPKMEKEVQVEDIKSILAKHGITTAYKLSAASFLCGGKTEKHIKNMPDGGATYIYGIRAVETVFKQKQPKLYANIQEARIKWRADQTKRAGLN